MKQGASRYSPPSVRATVVFTLVALVWDGGAQATEPEFLLGGIQVNEPDHQVWVKTLRRAGMNTVAVTAYAKQGDWDSSNLWFEPREPAVVAEIRAAKAAKLNVVLVLRVALDHAFARNRFLWHGMIMPTTDPAVDEWFRRYTSFVNQWADIARREGVTVLAVASEMSWLTSTATVSALPPLAEYYLDGSKQHAELHAYLRDAERIRRVHLRAEGAKEDEDLRTFISRRAAAKRRWATTVTYGHVDSATERIALVNRRRRRLRARWRSVIEAARRRFAGPITYAANFDQYREVDFWGDLDLIGINAYFQLRERLRGASADLPAKLDRGWRHHVGEMLAFRKQAGLTKHRILFTEMGYTFRRNSTLHPWASGGFSLVGSPPHARLVLWDEEPTVPEERAAAVRSLGRVLRGLKTDVLAGVLYWKLSTLPEHAMIEPFVTIVATPPVDPMQSALQSLAR